jgi:hypothetical protein
MQHSPCNKKEYSDKLKKQRPSYAKFSALRCFVKTYQLPIWRTKNSAAKNGGKNEDK